MRQFVLGALCTIAVVAYWVTIRNIFRVDQVQPLKFQTTLMPDSVVEVHEKDRLHWLLLLGNGSGELVDLTKGIALQPILQPVPFRSSWIGQSGTAYFLDGNKILYRWSEGMKMAKSRPLKIAGDLVAMAVEETPRIRWCVERRDTPDPDGLFIYAISLENGKMLGMVNVGPHRGKSHLFCSPDGNGIVVTVQDDPTAFQFRVMTKQVVSRSFRLNDLVTSVAFADSDVLLGLRSGIVTRFNLLSGQAVGDYESDFLPVTLVRVAGKKLEVSHGDSDSRGGIGSIASFDLKSRELLSQIGAKERVEGFAGDRSSSGILVGLHSARLQLLHGDSQLVDVKIDSHRLRSVDWIGGTNGVFGVIDGNKLDRVQLH